jgi:ankyrin repeat protein
MRSKWIACGLAACALAWALAAGAGDWDRGGIGMSGIDIASAPDFRREFSHSTGNLPYESPQLRGFRNPAGIDDLLIQAVERNDLDAAGRLLDQGAHSNAVVDDAGTRLLMTVRSASMARLLVAKGADSTLTDADGATALHRLVTSAAALNIIPVLMEAGGDVHARAYGWRGETAVLATWRLFIDMGMPEQGEKVVRMLAAYGADLNTFDADGFNLLLIGAANNSADLVQVVLDLGGQLDVTTREGLSPLDLARELRCAEAAALLEEAAAN